MSRSLRRCRATAPLRLLRGIGVRKLVSVVFFLALARSMGLLLFASRALGLALLRTRFFAKSSAPA